MGFGRLGAVFDRLGGGGSSHGGPFLLLVDGVSKVLLAATGRLKIVGAASGAYVPTYYFLGF